MQQGQLDQTASLGSCSQVVCVEKVQLDKKLSFELGPVNPANLQQLRMININTLPVRYSDKFYRDLLEKYDSDYLRFAFWNGFAVAAVCARLEDYDDSHPEWRKLYIMTINVLAAYRRRGVGKNFGFCLFEHLLHDFFSSFFFNQALSCFGSFLIKRRMTNLLKRYTCMCKLVTLMQENFTFVTDLKRWE